MSSCLRGFVPVMQRIWRETNDVAFALLLSACIRQISVFSSDTHQEAVVQPHPFVGAHTDGILVGQHSDSSMLQACTLGFFHVLRIGCRSAAMSIALPIAVFLSSFSHGFTRATQACYLSDTGVAYDTVLVYVFFNGNRWYTSLLRQGQEVGLRGMCLPCGKEKYVHLQKKRYLLEKHGSIAES